MNEFYETELNDADDSIDMPSARSDTHLNRADFATRKQAEQRRDLIKDDKQKLWESIVSEAGDNSEDEEKV